MKVKAIVKHMIIAGLAIILAASTTGCSVIAGIFGPEETIASDTDATAPRILLPTPTVQQNEIEPTESAATPTTVSPDESNQTPARRMVTITGASVNLRSQPSTTGQILRTVPSGTSFEFVDKNSAGDWYQFCCIDNQLAWVFAELAKVEEVASPMIESTNPAKEVSTVSVPESSTETVADPTTNTVIIDVPLSEAIFTQTAVDDGTRYDYQEQGFTITLPESWQPLNLSSEGLEESLNTLADEDPQLANIIEAQVQPLVNARFNFFAVELSAEILDSGFATTANLLKQPLPAEISLDFYAQLLAKQAEEKFGLTVPISLTSGSLPTGKSIMLTYEMGAAASNASQALIVTQYLIMQGQTVYALTFTTTPDQRESYAATFAAIAESFRLLDN